MSDAVTLAPEREVPPPAVAPAGPGRLRSVVVVRPYLFAAAVAAVVLAVYVVSRRAGMSPRSNRVEYGLHFAAAVTALGAFAAVWWARRRGRSWDADLLPALFGGLAALVMAVALNSTPFDVLGIGSDQSFRSAIVARFTDTWQLDDYSYRDRPAYYAPGYFWVLGRVADVAGIESWRMLKFGAIATAFLVPLISYLMWRRLVPVRVAALISATPLVFPFLNEAYAWLVQVAIVAWWLEGVHGLTRPGLRPRHPVVLGLIGALLFLTYYYYFFVFVIVGALFVVVQWRRRELRVATVRRGALVLGVAALGSAVYWAPLGWHFLTAAEFRSLNNRWLSAHSGDLLLPMLEPSVTGALCLLGLLFLVLTWREPLSRSLLIIVVALYLWHLVGFLFAVVDAPLMSFGMRALVPLVLFAAAVLGLVRVAGLARRRWPLEQVWRVTAAGAVLLGLFACDRFVTTVVESPAVRAAHNQALPDGSLPAHHEPKAFRPDPPPERIMRVIEAELGPGRRPVVLSDRQDLFALYPNYTFLQWNANYSHPTAQFHRRLRFLQDSAAVRDPAGFAARMRDNPFDRVDVLVLEVVDGGMLRFRTRADNFPDGTRVTPVLIPQRLVSAEHFRLTRLGDYLVAVPR